jgi:thioredoxin reductase (NADPH)
MMSIHGEIFDITIIGAGPVGLYGAIYAGSRGLRVKVIDSQPHAGGRLSTHYPDKTIYDVAGHPSIKAQDLVDRLVEQSERHEPEFFFGQRVERLTRGDDGIWSLHTSAGEHRSHTILISAGVGAFLPGKLDMPRSGELEGRGIYYDIKDLDAFKGKKTVVVGTGDHALQWAINLRSVTPDVTLVHRLHRLTAPGDVQTMLEESKVTLKFPFYELKEIHGEDKLDAVTIIDTSSGAEERIEAEALVLNIGFIVDLNRFKDWGLVVTQNSINVNDRMETNLPGVYAAGDIVTHAGKLKLISTGAGEAAAAVSAAEAWLKDKKAEQKRSAAGEARAMEDSGIVFSGFEAVQIAIILEKQALEFYKAAFFGAGTEKTKNLFAKMQRAKLDNISYIQEKVSGIFSSGGYAHEDLDDTAAGYLKGIAAKHVFAGNDLAKEALKNSGSDLQNIYTGIQVEEDLKVFHRKLAQEKRLAKAGEHFNRLIETKNTEIQQLRATQAELMEAGIVE